VGDDVGRSINAAGTVNPERRNVFLLGHELQLARIGRVKAAYNDHEVKFLLWVFLPVDEHFHRVLALLRFLTSKYPQEDEERGTSEKGEERRVQRACVASQIVSMMTKWSESTAGPYFSIIVFSKSLPTASVSPLMRGAELGEIRGEGGA
jgi:hypothetical protein